MNATIMTHDNETVAFRKLNATYLLAAVLSRSVVRVGQKKRNETKTGECPLFPLRKGEPP
jgi:hypothetical protein